MPGTPVRRKSEQEIVDSAVLTEPLRVGGYEEQESHATMRRLRILLDQRFLLLRITAYGLAICDCAGVSHSGPL